MLAAAAALLCALMLGTFLGYFSRSAQQEETPNMGQVSRPVREEQTPDAEHVATPAHENDPPIVVSEKPIQLGWIYKQHAGGKRDPTAMLVHGQGFGCLSAVQGKFGGWAEKVRVGVGDNNVWGVSGAGVEFGVDIKAHAYSVETRDHSPLSIAVNSYQWSPPSDAIRMLHKDEGLCVLTGITGGLNAPEHFMGIELHDDGYYWLHGISSDKRASVQATGVLLSREQSMAADVKEYVWQPGDEPVKMISSDEGICFLSMIGGNWSRAEDKARVHIGDDGFWYLSGGEAESHVFARAMAVRFHGEP